MECSFFLFSWMWGPAPDWLFKHTFSNALSLGGGCAFFGLMLPDATAFFAEWLAWAGCHKYKNYFVHTVVDNRNVSGYHDARGVSGGVLRGVYVRSTMERCVQ